CEALGIGRCADSRGQGISWIDFHFHDAAALHTFIGTVSTLGKNFSFVISIVAWVRINQTTNCSVLRGKFWLDAAPGMTISRNHDRALHGNAHALKPLVILRHAVI